MTGASKSLAQAIASRLWWSRYRSFLDVGCAEGGVTVQLAQTHQHLTGVGFDLPPVRPIFEAYAASAGLADRLRFQAGDLYEDPLPEAEVVILGHMLHGLDLEGKRLALSKAYQALPKDGLLIAFDMILDDERRRNTFGLLMSLNMLLETAGGFEYTGAECRAWLAEAGFRETRIEPLLGPHSMIVAVK
jgi:SAM-dependent methyltransferase